MSTADLRIVSAAPAPARWLGRVLVVAVLAFFGVFFALPLAWLLLAATKSTTQLNGLGGEQPLSFGSFDQLAENWSALVGEQDGIIYFSVTSDGTTGPQWIERLEKKGFRIGDYAKSVLRSSDFKPTNGVTTEIVILKGMLFADNERTTKNIRAEADRRNLTKPNAEVACLIRENFSDEEIKAMGFWIVTMHEPIKDSDGDLDLLYAHWFGDGDGCWLGAYYDEPSGGWGRNDGFAFAVSH